MTLADACATVQGEERAALNRASFNSAPELKLGPSDLILFSAKVGLAEHRPAYHALATPRCPSTAVGRMYELPRQVWQHVLMHGVELRRRSSRATSRGSRA
jgi:hypothetical protein